MIYGVTMVRDEADIIGYTLDHMLTQVDRILIADNLSTDGTLDIVLDAVKRSNGRVFVRIDDDPAYNQDVKMTELAHVAGQMGATWVVPFDADEAWFYLDALRSVPANVTRAYATQYIYVPTESDPTSFNPQLAIGYRMSICDAHRKVAFRYTPTAHLHMGNHDVHYPDGGDTVELGVIRHYMYRSLEQTRRKVRNGVAAYQASNKPLEYGSHWRYLATLTDAQWDEWWCNYTCQPGLVYDPWPA